MQDISPLTIRPSLFHLIFQLLFGGAFAVAACVIILNQGRLQLGANNATFGAILITLGVFGLALTGLFLVVQGIRKAKQPSLIFDHDGIRDNSNVFTLKSNFLPWSNIRGMAVIHSTLILKVQNPPRQRRNALMKQISREFDANYTIDINLISDAEHAALVQIANTLDRKTGIWRDLGEH